MHSRAMLLYTPYSSGHTNTRRCSAHSFLPSGGAGPPAKPQLGTTYAKRPDSSPLDPGAPEPWNSWTVGSGSQFNVRTKGTAAHARKDLHCVLASDVALVFGN